MHTACQTLSQARGNIAITVLAKQLNISKRTFERRFQNAIGTTPKKYARVVRLRHAVLQRADLNTWADVAYNMGYYDQSHFIHDFQELYGLSPDILYPQIISSPTIQVSGLLTLPKQ
jgi:transcriptional regulator GlxA family with amidase domain